MISLRPYQQEALDALLDYFKKHNGNPVASLPTGSGKSVIIGKLIEHVMQYPDQRILQVTHVKELIEQNYKRMLSIWPAAPAGIYSAGVGRKQTHFPITVCGIQSVYKKAQLFGKVDLIIIDECHLVSPSSETMYQKFINALLEINPDMRVCGLTATPYRTKEGLLTDGNLFTDICYELPMRRLIKEGYLSPLVSKGSVVQADLSGIKTIAGDYSKKDMAFRFDQEALTKAAVKEMLSYGHDRKKWLIFACSVDHAAHVCQALNDAGVPSGFVYGGLNKQERESELARHASGEYRAMVNYGVLTTGYDSPQIDMIALLRGTKSTGLYVQMLGRGMRIHPEKKNCLVLDFGGNIERHGPVDAVQINSDWGRGSGKSAVSIQPTKICPSCRSDCHAALRECPECGFEFERDAPSHDAEASDASVLSEPPKWEKVDSVKYAVHKKEGKPDSLKVTYMVGMRRVSEWWCFEHGGYAREKAVKNWYDADGYYPNPKTTEEAHDAAKERNQLTQPTQIKVNWNAKYPEVLDKQY